MKPAPIMGEEEIEEEEEEMEDQEQTKKKDLQQTQKPFARAVGKRALVGRYETERQSAEERSQRRAWRREGEEDWARRRDVRDESEM